MLDACDARNLQQNQNGRKKSRRILLVRLEAFIKDVCNLDGKVQCHRHANKEGKRTKSRRFFEEKVDA